MMNEIKVSKEDFERIQKIELEGLLEIDRICNKYGIKYTLNAGSLLGAVRHEGFIPWDDDIDIAMMRNDYIKFEEVCKKELGDRYFYQSHQTEKEYFRLFSKLRINGTVFKESVHSNYDIHHGIYIDIFPIDFVPNNKIKREIQIFLYSLFNYGLSAKYLNVNARRGKRKIFAYMLKILYFPFSKDFLYRNANKVAMYYKDTKKKYKTIIFSGAYLKKEMFDYGMFTEFTHLTFEGNSIMAISQYHKYLQTLYGDYMELPPSDKRVSHHNIIELKFE